MVHTPERALPVRILGDHAPIRPNGVEAAAVLEASFFNFRIHSFGRFFVVVKRPQVARAALEPRLPVAPRRHPRDPMEA